MQLNWKDLEVFVHVCEAGSLTKGAGRCHMSIPAVSARIQRLEDAAGSALLVRHSRGVVPTELGSTVLARARNASNEIAGLRTDLEAAREKRVPVRVLCNTSALLQHVPRFMGELLRIQPCSPIEVVESSSRRSVRELHEHQAQIAIVSDAVAVKGLDVEPLCEDHLIVAVAQDHPLRDESTSFAGALAYPQICFGASSALTTHLAEQAQAIGRNLRPRVCVNDLATICSLVERGYGVAVLSRAMWRSAMGARNLREVPLADRWAKRRLLACSPRGVAKDPDLRRIHDTVVEAFSTAGRNA
jgi:DNA-binding transcriptional LysR family regulator